MTIQVSVLRLVPVGGLIGTANLSKDGLMTTNYVQSLDTTSVIRGIPGGQPATWFKIATFAPQTYAPILFDGALGTFQEQSMNYFKFRITNYEGTINYSKESLPADVFGYTLENKNATIYLKLTSTQSAIMQMRGGSIISLSGESTTTEPDGITYLE